MIGYSFIPLGVPFAHGPGNGIVSFGLMGGLFAATQGGKISLSDYVASTAFLASLGSSSSLGDTAAASVSLTVGGASVVLSDAATDLDLPEDC